MGIAKQLKDEIYHCPPVLVLTGRPQDAWLATWSRAEAAVPHPLDPIQLAETAVALLRSRVPATPLMTAPTLARGPHRARRRAPTSAQEQAAWAMGEILAGEATPAQIAGLRGRAAGQGRDARRGRRPGRRDAAPRDARSPCRAGCSTSSAPAATARCRSTSPRWPRSWRPGAGARVVKHGNRSASSKSGSADVLEALGIRLDLPAERVAAVATEAGITFCFSAAFHPAMRHAAVPRRELGIGTVVQPARPADQPGPPGRAGDRLRRPADGAGDGRRVRRGAASTPGSSAATTASTS